VGIAIKGFKVKGQGQGHRPNVLFPADAVRFDRVTSLLLLRYIFPRFRRPLVRRRLFRVVAVVAV